MATNTTTLQGSFISLGSPVAIPLVSGVDWMQVTNLSKFGANANPGVGIQFYWQREMISAGSGGLIWYNSNGAATLNGAQLTVADGFQLIDSTTLTTGNPVAVTSTTNATQPVVATGSTAGLTAGSIVRLSNIAAVPNLMGIDFSIDTVVANTSFRIANALANAPGAVGGAGFYRIISPFLPNWYPSRRTIVKITQAAQAVVTTSVNHNYTVGQALRFYIPPQWGMTQLNQLIGNIVAVTSSTFTVNIDTTSFSPFVFPLVAAAPFTTAQVVPVGEETDQFSNPNLLDDATVNTGFSGILLAGGSLSPAGQAGDVIAWIGGKTFNGS